MCLRDKEEACHKWMRFYMCNNLCWGISLKLSGTRPFSLLHRKVIRPITSSSHVAHMEQGFWVLLSLWFAVGLECLSYTLVNLIYTYWKKVDQMCSKNNAQIIQIWIILGDILTAEPVFFFFMNQCVYLMDTCFMLLWTLPIYDFVLLSMLQVDQLSCNGDRRVQPDRSQAIRERLRGKGLPTGKCFVAVRIMATKRALWKTKFW